MYILSKLYKKSAKTTLKNQIWNHYFKIKIKIEA